MVLSRPRGRVAPLKKPGRFVELDGLRGIAAMAVVVTHFTTAFDDFIPGHRPFPCPVEYGRLGVQLFFMISGFVIFATTNRYPTAGRFAAARAVRLYPTYWACVTLTVVITWKIDELSQRWPVNLVNYTMFQSFVHVRNIDGAYWSLACELVFYALIAAGLLLFRGRLTNRVVLGFVTVWPLLGLAVTFVMSRHPSGSVRLLDKGLAGEYAALFCIGIVMHLVREGDGRWWAAVPALCLIGLLAAQFAEGPTTSLPLVVVMGIFITVTALPGVPFLRAQPLVWLGSISYPLYLLHQNIGYTILIFVADPLGPWASRILAVCGVVLLAWMVHVLVETKASNALDRALRRRLEPVRPTTTGGNG